MKKIVNYSLLIIALIFSSKSSKAETIQNKPIAYTLAIKNISIFDSRNKVILENKTILILDDTIAEIIDANENFEALKIIEGNNCLVVPGFIDTHMHLTQIFGDGNEIAPEYINNPSVYQEVLAEQYLTYGTTTIADMGQPEKWMNTSIGWQKNPQSNYPNIFTAGGALKSKQEREVNMNHSEVMNPDDARKKIKDYAKLGVKHIKLYSALNKPEMEAIVEEAKKQRINVYGHIDRNNITLPMAMDIGVKNFEHFFTLAESVFINGNWNTFRNAYNLKRISTTDEFAAAMIFLFENIKDNPDLERNFNKLIEELALKKATISTTIHVLGSVAERTNTFSSFTTFPLRDTPDLPNYNNKNKQDLKLAFNTMMQFLKIAHDKGIKIRIATDTHNGGKAMISELILLAEAGFSIKDVIQIATLNGAEALNIDNEYGCIEKGKKADLVIFEKSPFKDLRNFQSNKTVIKGGEIFIPKEPLPITMLNVINEKGLESGISWFQKVKNEFREDELNIVGYELLQINKIKEAIAIFKFALNEIPNSKITYNALHQEQLNIEGYKQLQKGNIEGAIEIFKFNVALFKESGNAYYSLGEVYLKDGNEVQAIFNFKKSLKINPNNTNAIEMLKKLNMK